MTENLNDVMTVGEVAEYLRIPKSSVYKLAQESRIPCQKVGKHWRFYRTALEDWLSQIHIPQKTSSSEKADPTSIES